MNKSFDITLLQGKEPLSCDCAPGCWGVHAKNWPAIAGNVDFIDKLYKFIWGDLSCLRGTYVKYEHKIGFLTTELREYVEKIYKEEFIDYPRHQ